MEKEEILRYIKGFSKISVRNVCLDLKIHYPNVMTGEASKKNMLKVKKEIERRIKVLEGKYENNN